MRDRIFYSTCFGFIFGVLSRSFFSLDLYLVFFLGGLSLILLLFGLIISNRKTGTLLFIFIASFSLGVLRFHYVDRPAPGIFESKVGDNSEFSGITVDEPAIGEKNQKLNVKIEEGGEKVEVLLTLPFGENFKYGDRINFEGTLQAPENFLTDTGKMFDYVNYLRKDGIIYVMSYPDAEIVSRGEGSKVKTALFSAKNKFLESINFAVPAPESLLLGGLVVGERSAFSEELREDFIRTGTIHIVALSGYNITIVAEWFMKIFKFLPQTLGIGAGVFAIFLFVVMTGASSTALRAGTMATLALIARATGRNYEIGRALLFAGVLMIAGNPFILAFDVSFQLSFIATVAVIFLAPRIEKYFQWVTPRVGLRDIVSVTCAAYIFVLPFILYKMGNLSLVALPANILVLPLIPLTMLLGFVTGFAGLLWQMLSLPTGYLVYFLLHYELGVIRLLSDFSFASFSVPNFPLWLTLAIYAYFVYFLFRREIALFFKAS